jgi:serine protease DegQ
MRRLWLLFAQTVTVGLAIWFIVTTLKPGWVNQPFSAAQGDPMGSALSLKEAPANSVGAQSSYRGAAQKAMPSVVNIYTSKEIQRARNPLLNDPFLRRFLASNQIRELSDNPAWAQASSLVLKVIS